MKSEHIQSEAENIRKFQNNDGPVVKVSVSGT